MIRCWLDRRHQATHTLCARDSFADPPRPVCFRCYLRHPYSRRCFTVRPIPWVQQPAWLDEWRT